MPKTYTVESVLNTPDKDLLIMNDEEFVAALNFLAEHLPKTGWDIEEFNAVELMVSFVNMYLEAVPQAALIMADHKDFNAALKIANAILRLFPDDDEE